MTEHEQGTWDRWSNKVLADLGDLKSQNSRFGEAITGMAIQIGKLEVNMESQIRGLETNAKIHGAIWGAIVAAFTSSAVSGLMLYLGRK